MHCPGNELILTWSERASCIHENRCGCDVQRSQNVTRFERRKRKGTPLIQLCMNIIDGERRDVEQALVVPARRRSIQRCRASWVDEVAGCCQIIGERPG